MNLPEILHTISQALQKEHAKAIIVGGAVRDHFLHLPVKDYDIEVYGLETLEILENILSFYGSVNLVGKSFGVLKFVHDNEVYDFSFPRQDLKVSKGHRGFEVRTNGELDFKEASKRRDFTVNALGYDIAEKIFLDPYNGLQDMEKGVLRHIDDDSFGEDPLRVYRAVQFCARFEYVLAAETEVLCRNMVKENVLEELPKERVYVEFKKLLLKSKKPSLGFELMKTLGVLRYYPEVEALIGVPQEPKWHPEGDVWIHTMLSLDAMAKLCMSECLHPDDQEKRALKMLWAALCHDLGKATMTKIEEDGNITSIGHEHAGIALTRSCMYRLTDEHDFIESILPLVEHHLKPSQFYAQGAKSAAIRRLANKVNIEELVCVAKADFLGRSTDEALQGEYEAGQWLLEKAKALHVQNAPLVSLLQGRDLISLGIEPSVQFKYILDEVYTLQLEGEIATKEEAVAHVKKRFLQK